MFEVLGSAYWESGGFRVGRLFSKFYKIGVIGLLERYLMITGKYTFL